jgi:hypothetical protein
VTLLDHLISEMARQDAIHPAGYPATRDGIFLAITTAGQEELLHEAMQAWRAARCKCPVPRCEHADFTEVAVEMLQAAAVLLRCIRMIWNETL